MTEHKNELPPRWAELLLTKLGREQTLEEVQGDLREMFIHWVEKYGLRKAQLYYVWTILPLLRPFRRGGFRFNFNHGLFKSYLRLSGRNFVRNSAYSLINLSGLTAGLTASILIFIFVQDELNYEKFLPEYENIVRLQPTVTQGTRQQTWATSEGFMVPTLQTYPEVESSTRILRLDDGITFNWESKQFKEGDAIAVDDKFFDVFQFPFVFGDRSSALSHPNSIVISKEVASRLFGNTDPVGKVVKRDTSSIVISGVFDDIPKASHLKFKVVVPLRNIWPEADQSRNMYAFYSYLRLRSKENRISLAEKLLADWRKIYGTHLQDGFSTRLDLMPVAAIHLESAAEKEFASNGSMQVVYIFIAIACLILMIVVINYINLSNAIALKRVREIAIRKTIGASQAKLTLAFITESHVFSLLAILFSLAIAIMLLPQFNSLTAKEFTWHHVFSLPLFGTVILIWVLMGNLSGAYPARVLSSFNPIQILRSGTTVGKGGTVSQYFRRGMLVFQFAISSLLIVTAWTVWDQMNLISTLDTGFNKNNVVVISLPGEAYDKLDFFKQEVKNVPGVENSSFTSAIPGKRIVVLSVRVPELRGVRNAQDEGSREMRVLAVDEDFVKTMKLEIVAGRDFSLSAGTDRESAFLLNEEAVKEFNLKDPVGKSFEYTFRMQKKGQIVGVVRNFNYSSIHTKIEPLMIHLLPWRSFLCVRLNAGNAREAINRIEGIWKLTSSLPFTYNFLDKTYDAQYKSDRITAELITNLTILAVFFAALGLFGVVSFFIVQRTREVGIRKVFGASHFSLAKQLSSEYLRVVVIGNLIALYPSWSLANWWLQNFALHIEPSVLTFVWSFAACLALAAFAITHVLVKTLSTSPASILRSE